MAEAARDPREITTPDAFSVAPDLLGLPLARPLRRAVAMLIDLIAIAILTGAGWFFLGLGLAYSLFRFAGRPSRGAISRGSRWNLRFAWLAGAGSDAGRRLALVLLRS